MRYLKQKTILQKNKFKKVDKVFCCDIIKIQKYVKGQTCRNAWTQSYRD